MVVLTALTDDKRWAGVYPTRKPRGARASNPINLPSQRLELGSHGLGRSEGVAPKGTSTWGNKLMPPASNAWVSPSLPYPKNDGASGSPSHIDDRPSRGSSTSSSTVGNDFLDLPSYHLPTAANHSLSTETRSGSLQLSRFPDSFTNALKAPLRTIGKRSPTSHAKGFSLSMDDFPTLGTKNSESNSQQVAGRRLQGRPSFGSGTVVAQDEQRKGLKTGVAEVISSPNYEHENILRTCYVYEGDDPVPAAKLTREAQAQQAQLHGTQAPNICMPPPWSEYWHPSPDHPPDRNGMLHKGEAPYVPYKRADPPGSLRVESFAHCDQLLLNQQASARQDTRHGDYYSDNDPYHPHTPADCCVINQPPHILGKVKDDRSDALEKQPIIKKDVALLEKIKCLNNKARNLRALNLSELSSSKESKVKHPKDIGVEADHVTKDAPSSAATSEIVPAFNKLNSISESSNSLPNNPPNVPANGVIAVGLSEGQVTEFGEARKPSKPADYHAYGRGNTSRNRLDDSAKDMPSSSICGHVWEEHSTVESLRGVVMTDAQHGKPSSRNTSQQAHVTAAYKLPNWPDYEVQYARMRYLSAQAAKQLQDAEDWISQQKANAIAKLEELSRRPSVESQKSNDAPPEADNLYCKQKTGGDETIKRDSSTADTRCIVSADGLNAPQPANGGVSNGLLIHNVMSSAKNTEVNMMEHIIHKSTSQSHDNSAPRHWQMENRRRQFDSRERNKRDMSNVAETPVDTQSTEAKPHDDVSTRNKNSRRDSAAVRPAAPPVISNENNTTEVSSMHKTHLPCVAINGSMIPAQVTSVTGVMVGSIMLADVPLASVKQECAAAAKEVHDTTNSFSRPQQIKKSGKNQHGALPIENPLWNDSVMCTPIKQPSKKEQHEEGSPNSMAVAAPTRLSGNHIIVSENVATMKRTEIDWYAHMPIYKEPHQLNLGQIFPAENHTCLTIIGQNQIWRPRVMIKKHLLISMLVKLKLQLSLTGWIGKLAGIMKGGLVLLGNKRVLMDWLWWCRILLNRQAISMWQMLYRSHLINGSK